MTLAPPLPPGRHVDLPGRGTTFCRVAEGPPGAPTLLLLHGWTATADLNWFRCYQPLSRRFRVIALDHRGHGRGIRTKRLFTLEGCADDAAALARALGAEQVIPVGYSMGGPIAQLVWRRHRDLVSGLVLCATSRNFGRSLQERAMFTSLLGLSGVARLTPETLRRRVADRIFERRLDQSPLAQWAADEIRRNDPAAVLEAGWAIGRFTSAEWIGGVDVPASVVVTMHDNVVPPRRQLKLAESIPDAEVFTVPGDHASCVADAHHFVPALLDACSSVVDRAEAAVGSERPRHPGPPGRC
ncbi:MAG TPA: alpha/beta fold hydrolase [Acidimicrobiales bacterium]|nr:alpha/beta fold hydrolase [Acidimicrobiales bacterium]